MASKKLDPIHPGEILAEEYLTPLGISQYRLAKDISVPARRINEIVQGKRGILADTALRLARYFGTSERFWINLQAHYDLDLQKDKLGPRLKKEVAEFQKAFLPWSRNNKASGVDPSRTAILSSDADFRPSPLFNRIRTGSV